ncbi:alpha/beta fold hydrolase [Streptomyces sulphureus]|uniref:alpha/beta fold hydrolase n=1 Tax=Streptomyces sulphureus TaxID=47758 RepID=UPI000376BA5D|nr:alpha/beta hydrolase [Streptomyces sulphureus]
MSLPAHATPPDRFLTPEALADLADLPAHSRWVRAGSLPLHLLDYGGDAPPLLILPGITSPAVTMDFVARRLTDLVRPLVLDVRGRGLSGDGEGYSLTEYATDVEAVVDGLALDRPLLLGHSMGARIAAATAVRGTVELSGTVLVDPPTSGPGRGAYPTSREAFLGQLAEARRGTDAEEVGRSWPRWPLRERALRARWLASCGEAALVGTHEGFETEDFFHLWPDVPSPTTLLYGADSPVMPAEAVAEAARALPTATFREIPDAGHMVFWDNPEASLDLLRETLRGLLD